MYDHGSFDSRNSGWEVRRPRRRASPFVHALIGAIVGGLVVLLAVGYAFPQLVPGGAAGAREGGERSPIAGLFSPDGRPLGGIASAKTVARGPFETSAIVQVVQEVGPSVVGIINYRTVTDVWSGRSAVVPAAFGSGVIIDEQGHIVTNHHVVENAARLEVVIGEDQQRVPAELVAHDAPYSDLAILRIDPGRLPAGVLKPARFGDSDAVQVGETVVAIGNPKGLDFFRSATVGVVSGIRSDLLQKLERDAGYPSSSRVFKLIQTDAAINGGNSGGPLVNLNGEVIGINTLKLGGPDTEGMGFAIPANEVRRIVNDLIRHGYVIRPALGVAVIPEDMARMRYGITEGLLIQVEPGGPAARAGLRDGDVILAIDGTATNDFLSLLKEISKHEVGDVVTLRVRRDQRVFEAQVELGQLQASARR